MATDCNCTINPVYDYYSYIYYWAQTAQVFAHGAPRRATQMMLVCVLSRCVCVIQTCF